MTPPPNPSKPGPDYAGDVSVAEAWSMLTGNPEARLIDVRSAAEWTFIGAPELSSIGKSTIFAELQRFPGMSANAQFVSEASEALERAGARRSSPVLCICRSGARSRAAAIALTRAGFTEAYNVAGGFEGDPDSEGHRGRVNGWKAANLPWRQT